MKNKNLKVNQTFWRTIFFVMIISLGLSLVLDVYPGLTILFYMTFLVSLLIFEIGMCIFAFKLKKIGWGIFIIILGFIVPTIFYFKYIVEKEDEI